MSESYSTASGMLRKYYESGFNVIPVSGKRPAFDVFNHTDWATRRMPESLIDQYEKIPCTGIGIITGPASGVIGIDIDTNEKEVLDKIPRSICSKIGAKGETRFFRYSPGVDKKLTFKRASGELLEVLANGHMSVLQGSIHPDTGKPYVNAPGCKSLLDVDLESLPILSMEEILELGRWFQGDKPQGATASKDYTTVIYHDHEKCPICPRPTVRCPHGAQDRIKGMLAGFIAQKKTKEEVIDDICAYDLMKHRPIGYLSDKTRSDFRGNAHKTAENMYMSVLKSINELRIKNGLAPQFPQEPMIISIKDFERKEPKADAVFPELPGLLGVFKDGILHKTRRNQEALAIGGALALGSVLCAHRFGINKTLAHTKLYILNIGKTGVGKDAPFKYIKAVLTHPEMRDEHLLGLENYSSKAAVLETLTNQRVRIDLRDEFKDTFIAIANNKGASGNEISSFLNQHYTDSGWYGGHYTKTDKWVGSCYDPSISILAGIQPQELVNNATLSNFSDGFMGRFMYFVANTQAQHVGRQHNSLSDVVECAVDEIRRILPPLKYISDTLAGPIPAELWTPETQELTYDKNYAKHRDEKDRHLADIEDKLDDAGNEQERALLTRQNMFIERLTIIIAVCSGDRTITVDHSKVAENLVQSSQARSFELVGVSGMSKIEGDIKKVLSEIKRHGFMIRGDISKLTKRDKREMKDLIDTMLERELIDESSTGSPSRNGKVPLVYHLPKAP
jgi:hypothetical protein